MTPEEKDQWAKGHLFMTLRDGEAYERRMNDNGCLYVFLDERNLWIVEYHTGFHDAKGKYHQKSTVKVDGVKWEKAVSEAESYIRWFTKTTKGGSQGCDQETTISKSPSSNTRKAAAKKSSARKSSLSSTEEPILSLFN